jgi:hypothetical protein
MPNTRHSSSDVPDFSSYPDEPLAQAPTLEATYRTYRRYSEPERNRLLEPSRRIGRGIGRAVANVRDRLATMRSSEGGTSPATRVNRLVQEKPIQVLLGIAAAGLATGVGIRIWRRNA